MANVIGIYWIWRFKVVGLCFFSGKSLFIFVIQRPRDDPHFQQPDIVRKKHASNLHHIQTNITKPPAETTSREISKQVVAFTSQGGDFVCWLTKRGPLKCKNRHNSIISSVVATLPQQRNLVFKRYNVGFAAYTQLYCMSKNVPRCFEKSIGGSCLINSSLFSIEKQKCSDRSQLRSFLSSSLCFSLPHLWMNRPHLCYANTSSVQIQYKYLTEKSILKQQNVIGISKHAPYLKYKMSINVMHSLLMFLHNLRGTKYILKLIFNEAVKFYNFSIRKKLTQYTVSWLSLNLHLLFSVELFTELSKISSMVNSLWTF